MQVLIVVLYMNSLKSNCYTGILLVILSGLPHSEVYVDFHDLIPTFPIYYWSNENFINIYCLFSGTVPECWAGFQHTFSLPAWWPLCSLWSRWISHCCPSKLRNDMDMGHQTPPGDPTQRFKGMTLFCLLVDLTASQILSCWITFNMWVHTEDIGAFLSDSQTGQYDLIWRVLIRFIEIK